MNNPPFHLCKTCNKQYYKKPATSKLEWPKSQYCSRKCINVGRKPFNKGKPMREWMHGEHPMLGKHHTDEARQKIKTKRADQVTTLSMLKGLEYGRKKAWTPEMRARMSQVAKDRKLGYGKGEQAANWRGGRTPLVRSYRAHSNYKIWRSAIFARDNYTCLKCGVHNPLEANHIKTVKEIFIGNSFVTMDDVLACPILWDISNGETLCRSCHRLVGDKMDDNQS